ncbi:MAG: hypothetical protein LBV32_03100 [Tannerellaceae bacterium]|nr:hypothetical protein [Tannerellaceae bacterium]
MTPNTIFNKYSPLWYAAMAMNAFSNGDYELTHQYFEQGQDILDCTGSLFLAKAEYKNPEEAEEFSMSTECKNIQRGN